jgi:hypothetical protein
MANTITLDKAGFQLLTCYRIANAEFLAAEKELYDHPGEDYESPLVKAYNAAYEERRVVALELASYLNCTAPEVFNG